jgi:prefoldin subunit 5
MSHHIRPCVPRKPDQIILHVGTNYIRDKQTNEIVNGILENEEIIKKESPTTNVVISELIHRTDKAEFSQKVDKANEMLAKACQRRNLNYIKHKTFRTNT